MKTSFCIALDAMGGDHGPQVVVPAALDYLKQNNDVGLILVGQEDALRQYLPEDLPKGIKLQHATQVVTMEDLPSQALRKKKDSSMRVAINLVKEGRADACVSAGNTGALMATARFVLKTLPHIDRPAITTVMPSTDGRIWVLDLGANVDCSADHLFQFAVMASELVSAVDNIPSPTVGLLNIGEEEIKGNEQVKQANELLTNSNLNYLGYVEGDDIYLKEGLDIVVADGFVGNVSLKTTEGVAKLIKHFMKVEFTRSLYGRLAALIAMPMLKGLGKRIDPRRYNGASLLGLRGIVIKSHGGADAFAFRHAIGIARKEVKADVANRILRRVEAQMGGHQDSRERT